MARGVKRSYAGQSSQPVKMYRPSDNARAQTRPYQAPAGSLGTRGTRQRVRGFLGAAGDAKYVDVATASYAMDTTGSITHVSIVPQGTTVNQRDGKACRITSLQIRGAIVADVDSIVADNVIAVVWDYQPNKALPTITDIFDSKSNVALPKRENAGRFKIIRYMKAVTTGSGDDTPPHSSNTMVSLNEYIKMPPDCVATYTTADNTGVIGNCISGALYFVTMGSGVKLAGTGADATVFMRTNFVDL